MRDCSQHAHWRFRPYARDNSASPLDYVACQFDDPANPHVQISDQFIQEIAARFPNSINLGSRKYEGFIDGTELTAEEKLEVLKSAKLYIGIDCDLSHLAGTTGGPCVVVHPTTHGPHFCFPSMSQYRFFTSIEQFDSLKSPSKIFDNIFQVFKQRQCRTVIEVGNRSLLEGIESTRLFAQCANIVCTLNSDFIAVKRAREATKTFNNVFTFKAPPINGIARMAIPIDLLYFGEYQNYDSHLNVYMAARKRLNGRSMLLIEDRTSHANLLEYAMKDGFKLISQDARALLIRSGFVRLRVIRATGYDA